MSLPYGCSTRALRNLLRVPSSLISSQRGIAGPIYCQCRGLSRSKSRLQPQQSPPRAINKPYDPEAYVNIQPWEPMHVAFLRDSCTCPICVNPSSKQKNFQTTDIPKDLRVRSLDISSEDGTVEILWENDIPGLEAHKSIYPPEFFNTHSTPYAIHKSRFQNGRSVLWNKNMISKELEFVKYDDYMNTDAGLYRALRHLFKFGLLLLREVPQAEKSVEDIALRIGSLRDSLYGRTWDVKSIPEAKNVAYTSSFLGLHMDLLYMANPPGFQFLHCMHNSCEGGSSLFSDASWAATQLSNESFSTLTKMKVAYHYRNAGEHYYYRHPVIEVSRSVTPHSGPKSQAVGFVNYSPPFQANHIQVGQNQQDGFPLLLDALREFSSLVENEDNLFEYRLQEGECVIFNNRRILHGRRQFDTATGTRWLRGAYVDTDVFMSKYRVLSEMFVGQRTGVGEKVIDSMAS